MHKGRKDTAKQSSGTARTKLETLYQQAFKPTYSGKQMRITVKKHHEQYLQMISAQMGVSDTAEALNMLLWELRRINYAFGSPLPQYPMTNDQQHYDPSTFETQATAMSGLSWQPQSPQAIRDFEDSQELQQEIDPIIARMALLVDEF